MARLFTFLGITWEFAPRTFDIGGHTYTPDFFLPQSGTYIEVKNFWSSYAAKRDAAFRARYPDIVLKVIMKDEYKGLELAYARHIAGWEYAYEPKPRSA